MRVGYFQLGKNGRLGNQLFQIFSTYGISMRWNSTCHFNYVPCLDRLPNVEWKEEFAPKKKLCEQGNLIYTPFHKEGDVEIQGYLQSYKYFENLPESCFRFTLGTKVNLDIWEQLQSESSCFVHIRRGDYVRVCSNLLDKDYYFDAMDAMGKDKKFFIFSDDIPYCQDMFNGSDFNVFHVNNGTPYQDLWALSQFKNGIISNSSFSWWGARLNQKPDRIIAPLRWFSKEETDTDDLLYDEWEKI
jgi:hypothetical protein